MASFVERQALNIVGVLLASTGWCFRGRCPARRPPSADPVRSFKLVCEWGSRPHSADGRQVAHVFV